MSEYRCDDCEKIVKFAYSKKGRVLCRKCYVESGGNPRKHTINFQEHQIKHFNLEGKYLCNRATKPKKFKLTTDWNKVSCTNCKRYYKVYLNS